MVVTLSSLISGCGIFKGEGEGEGVFVAKALTLTLARKGEMHMLLYHKKKDTLHWTLLVR